MTLTQILQKIRNAFYTKSEIDSMGGGASLSDTISQKADKSDLSNYLPREDTGYKTISGNGQYLWCKFATITIKYGYVNSPICFEVAGRNRLKSNLQVRFANSDSSDPSLAMFITDNDTNFYIKKVATSTWELYCSYDNNWGSLTIYRVVNDVKGSSVTINTTFVNLETEPTDKIQCTLRSEGIEEQGSNYIRYSSGIQICWGQVGVSVNDNWVTFPKSFVDKDKIIVTTSAKSSNSMYINMSGTLTTGFTLYISNGSGAVLWQAIGYWK